MFLLCSRVGKDIIILVTLYYISYENIEKSLWYALISLDGSCVTYAVPIQEMHTAIWSDHQHVTVILNSDMILWSIMVTPKYFVAIWNIYTIQSPGGVHLLRSNF